MNRQEREVRSLNLSDEEQLLRDLYERYDKVTVELERLIKELKLDFDDPKVIYQIERQQELEVRISEILADLNAKDEESVKGFLTKCAELGFIGALYSMYHQGFAKDVKTGYSVNSDYSKRLAYHNSQLQLEAKAEITRGIAAGMAVEDISRNVRDRVNASRNKVVTVAVTEGGRTFEENNYGAMLEAQAQGAEVEKEWCSVMDNKVRPDHLKLHGQIVPLDEPFVLESEDGNTYTAMYPHGFGVAKEDINCRCTAFPRIKNPTGQANGFGSYSLFKKALIATGLAWMAFGNDTSD